MKKILISLMAAVASVGMIAYGAPSTVASYSAPNLVSEINTALANPTNTTLNVDGKSTLNGELEVNNSDVDINMTLSANEIDIAQTNTTGQASTPLININDDRTGATANEASEAALYIDSDGAYGLTVADGIVQIEAEIDTASGDILLDPAGSEVHIDGGLHVGGTDAVGDNNIKVDGTAEITGVATFTAESIHNAGIDADYITTDAGLGIDTKSAGKLMIGTNTATSIDYGSVSVTAHTFVTDGTGTGEIVLPNESIGNAELASGIDAAKLLAASVASAIDGSAITNIPNAGITSLSAAKLTAGTVATAIDGSGITNLAGGNIASGTIDNARLDSDLQPLAEDDGGGLTNIVSGGIVSLSAAKLQAATVATAIDGNAITNLNGGNFGSSMTAANLTAGTVASAIDISAATNLPSAGIVGLNADKLTVGTIASAVDISACTNLPNAGITGLNAAKLTAGTIASAIDGSGITNITAANVGTGYSAANLTAGSVASAIDGGAITNMASATAFPGYAVCVVTNLDANGITNIITYIGTVSYP